jgi:hypothetical protein
MNHREKNGMPNKQKKNKLITFPSEWKRNKTKLLRNAGHTYRTFKKCTELSARKTVPLQGVQMD